MAKPLHVAVIGAGAAGLCSARELVSEGHRVAIFEKLDRIGGTWLYGEAGTLYRTLCINIPRQLMGFSDYPLPAPEACFSDPKLFPGHAELLAYLEAFARDSGIIGALRLGAEVVRVRRVGEANDRWAVEWRRNPPAEAAEMEYFDAVVVCNGHFRQPRFADIPGIEKWPGKQIHSANYRIPEPFQNQVVVIVGWGSSAFDISVELSTSAKEVHSAVNSSDIVPGKLEGYDNIFQHFMIKCVHEDGTVDFEDGAIVLADVILHCTGYNYSFPFFETDEIVRVEDGRVGPLFKHVFPPRLAPWISFVGIPSKVLFFYMIEIQSKWVAKVLSGKVGLPTEERMIASIEEHYIKLEEMQRPKHHTHNLSLEPEYLGWLAAEVGCPPLEEWKLRILKTLMKSVVSRDYGYRDRFDFDQWMSQFTPTN